MKKIDERKHEQTDKIVRTKKHIWIAIAGALIIVMSGLFLMFLAIKHFLTQICEITHC